MVKKSITFFVIMFMVLFLAHAFGANAIHTYVIPYNVSNYTIVVGTYVSGDLGNLTMVDSQTLNVSEKVGSPAYDVRFNFYNVTNTEIEDNFDFDVYMEFVGTAGQTIYMQIWNVTSGTWCTIQTIPSSASFGWYNYTIPKACAYNTTSQEVWARLLHVSNGNINQYVSIDYFVLSETDLDEHNETIITPFGDTAYCPITTTPETMLFIFLGLLVLGFMAWASWTSRLIISVLAGLFGIVWSFQLFACFWIFGAVVLLGSVLYIMYETFLRFD